jgi:hypothetical protein
MQVQCEADPLPLLRMESLTAEGEMLTRCLLPWFGNYESHRATMACVSVETGNYHDDTFTLDQ